MSALARRETKPDAPMSKLFDRGLLRVAVKGYAKLHNIGYEDAHLHLRDWARENPNPNLEPKRPIRGAGPDDCMEHLANVRQRFAIHKREMA